MRKMLLAIVAASAILSGCASTPTMGNVIPMAGGKYEVSSMGASQDEAMKSALYTAQTVCNERKMRHVIESKTTAYKGMVSEEANRTMNVAAGFLAMATKSYIPTLSGDDDYHVKLGFYCES